MRLLRGRFARRQTVGEGVAEKGWSGVWPIVFFTVQNGGGASVGRGASSASATLRPPHPLDPRTVLSGKHFSPFELPPFPFCSRPDRKSRRVDPFIKSSWSLAPGWRGLNWNTNGSAKS